MACQIRNRGFAPFVDKSPTMRTESSQSEEY